jgi:hypothetical protein
MYAPANGDAGRDAPFADDESRAAEGGPRFRVLEAPAIWAPLEPPVFVVAGMLPRGSLAMVCATGSSLKTWMVLALTIAVASGGKWLERFACEAGGALFVDWESGEDELRRRLQRLSAERVDHVALLTMPELFFNSPDLEAVASEWAKSYRLVVFDSLAAGTLDVDENDARFAQGLRVLKRVAAASGCVFAVLHHSRKGRADGDGGDERDMPRGTSAIYAACDVVLQLSRADEGAFQVRQTKARGGKSVDPFVVRVDDVGPRTTVRATDVQTSKPKTGDAKWNDCGRALVEAARRHPGKSGNVLVERVDGYGRAYKLAVLADLASTGRLFNAGTKERPQWRVGSVRNRSGCPEPAGEPGDERSVSEDENRLDAEETDA